MHISLEYLLGFFRILYKQKNPEMINLNLTGVLYLDIETAPQYKAYEELPERMKPLWDKKFAGTFAAKDNPDKNSIDDYFDCNLYGEFCKIICISVGIKINDQELRIKSYYGHDEKKLLQEFVEMLNNSSVIKSLCAHNGKEFDFPLLCKRMIINGIKLPELLQIAGKKPWEIFLLDTKELWKFGSYRDSVSLDLLAAVLGLPSPKAEITGAEVAKAYWHENRLEDIKNYCQRDTVTLANIALKLTGQNAFTDENIVYA